MKQNDIFSALSFVDDELTERAHKTMQGEHKYKKIAAWKRWSMVAACVCLVLALIPMLFQPSKPLPPGAMDTPPSEEGPVQRVDMINHSIYPGEKLWVPEYNLSTGNTSGSDGATEEAPATEAYMRGLGVVAKVVEILPDIYVDAASSSSIDSKYHILRLEILEELYGENIPKELYFRLRSYLDPSLDEYDYIVIGGMEQIGFEDYAMTNVTQKRAENFTLMFECSGFTARGAILPFKDGVFSLEHWKKDGWLNWFRDEWENLTVGSFCFFDEDFPARDGCTLEDTKQAINALRDPEKYWRITFDRVRTNEIFATEEQKEVLAYVKPYDNGLFAQSANCNSGTVWYTRNIGGFITNETIRMTDEGDIEYKGERFTQQDLESIQDLGAFVSALDLNAVNPPHTPGHEQMEIATRYFEAKYVKHNGTVYGVVRVVWTLKQPGESWRDTLYYDDDLYYLIMPDGTCRTVEVEELKEYIGDDSIVNKINYGVGYYRYFY